MQVVEDHASRAFQHAHRLLNAPDVDIRTNVEAVGQDQSLEVKRTTLGAAVGRRRSVDDHRPADVENQLLGKTASGRGGIVRGLAQTEHLNTMTTKHLREVFKLLHGLARISAGVSVRRFCQALSPAVSSLKPKPGRDHDHRGCTLMYDDARYKSPSS